MAMVGKLIAELNLTPADFDRGARRVQRSIADLRAAFGDVIVPPARHRCPDFWYIARTARLSDQYGAALARTKTDGSG